MRQTGAGRLRQGSYKYMKKPSQKSARVGGSALSSMELLIMFEYTSSKDHWTVHPERLY